MVVVTSTAFFDTIIDNDKWLGEGNSQNTDRYLSEDYLFCQLSPRWDTRFGSVLGCNSVTLVRTSLKVTWAADIQGRQMYKKQHGVNPSRKNPPKRRSVENNNSQRSTSHHKERFQERPESVGEELFPLTPVPEWKKKEMKQKSEEKKNEPA